MERKASKTEKGRERDQKNETLVQRKNRPALDSIGMAVVAGVAAVLSGSSTRAETLEERLGNIENYQPVEFVNSLDTQVGAWCILEDSILRWQRVNRENPLITSVVQRPFRLVHPPAITTDGSEVVVRDTEPDRVYGESFTTELENRFEAVGFLTPSWQDVLFRNDERFIDTPVPNTMDWTRIYPFWGNKILAVADGFDRGGTADPADLFEFNESETRLPLTEENFYTIGRRRTDLNLDPAEADQVGVESSFAATANYAFVTRHISRGRVRLTTPDIFLYDRSGDEAINMRPLLNTTHSERVRCAFENDDAVISFVEIDGDSTFRYAAYLKDADSDEVPNLVDNCPAVPNPADEFGRQPNSDEDPLGDVCDKCPQDTVVSRGETDDPDNDNVCNRVGNESLGTTGDDNCPQIANPDQLDTDSDRRGNVCDTCPGDRENDRDRDDVCAGNPVGEELANDNCPINRNPDQLDTDIDGAGDACDQCPLDPLNDEDHDFLCANEDPCPTDFENKDEDRDGLCDNVNDPCVEGFEQCQTEPDAGMTERPDAGEKPDASSKPDANIQTPDASDGRIQRDAGTDRTDTNINTSEPPKDGCTDCNQTGKSPLTIIGLIALAATKVLRRRRTHQHPQ